MAQITYTAIDRGYLVSSHSEFSDYSIDFEIEGFDERLTSTNTVNKSLNGYTETIFDRIEQYFTVTAVFLDADTKDQFKEFFSSVAGGEPFELEDHLSTTHTNCKLENYEMAPARVGITERFNIAMTIRREIV